LRYGGRTRPFLAVLVADEFAPDAWRNGRSEGVVVTTPKLLFGDAVAAALAELTRVLTNAAAAAVNDPEAISRLFEQLSKIEGAAANLRGPLFEMIVGHCVNAGEGRSIDIGKRVTTPDGERAEIDVLGMLKNSAKAIECKGREPGHVERLLAVKEWLEVKVPRIITWLRRREDYASVPCEFEYWTTGEFEPDAVAYLSQQQQRIKKYTINWKGGKDVVQYARTMNESRIVETLQEQFFRHPLATEQRRSTRPARPAVASIAPQPNAAALVAVISAAPAQEGQPARDAAETSGATDH
jgi:hypothetical protein